MEENFFLSDEEARELIKSCATVAQAAKIERIGEGSEHNVWTINDELILRVPVDQEDEEPSLRDARLLDFLGKDPKMAHAIPKCVQMGTWAQRGCRYGIYRKMKGVSIESAPEAVTKTTEKDLVYFLVALKNIPLDALSSIGMPNAEVVYIPELVDAATQALARLRNKNQLGYVPDAIDQQQLSIPSKFQSRKLDDVKIFTHADLKGEHIFIDPHNGSLTGIIDWSDAAIGCPSADIWGLAISVGAKMATRIGFAAGYEEAILRKGVLIARCNALLYLDGRLNGTDDSPEWLLRRQLKRAFELVFDQ